MKQYLLDTHVLLWILNGSELVSQTAKEIYCDEDNEVFVSMASIWEMAIKISLKKLELPCSLSSLIEDHILGSRIKILNIKSHHCIEASHLEFFHSDPFDRMIISQAIQENSPLISKDSVFRKYPVNVIW